MAVVIITAAKEKCRQGRGEDMMDDWVKQTKDTHRTPIRLLFLSHVKPKVNDELF